MWNVFGTEEEEEEAAAAAAVWRLFLLACCAKKLLSRLVKITATYRIIIIKSHTTLKRRQARFSLKVGLFFGAKMVALSCCGW